MKLIGISGKSVNVEGLEMTEKEFADFLGKQQPWRGMVPAKRKEELKKAFKLYKKAKSNKKEEGQ